MQKLLLYLSLAGKALSGLTALNAIPSIPASDSVLIFFAASVLKDVVNRFSEFIEENYLTPAQKNALAFLAIGTFALFGTSGCATNPATGVTTLDPTAQTILSSIQQTAGTLAKSGALPQGKTTDVVNDVSTISNALQTINTGDGISPSAAAAVAQSFHSNSATTAYATMGATVIDALVPAINALINQGASKATVQNVTTQVLTNAPNAVAAGVSSPPDVPTATPTNSTSTTGTTTNP